MFCNAPTCQQMPFAAPRIGTQSTPPQQLYPLNTMGIRRDGTAVPVTTNMPGCANGWVSPNPITYDVQRAIQTVFDAPVYTGQVNVGNTCQDEIYTPQYRMYGKGYRNYMDINSGDVQYYLDNSRVEPYTTPDFITPATVTNQLYVDPMGQVKPEYNRVPLTDYSWNRAPQTGQYSACDSYTHDTLEFRQDLMARQMRRMNQQNWAYRFGAQLIADTEAAPALVPDSARKAWW